MTDTTSTPSAEFFSELAAAQQEFLPVRKNRVNPATRSQYADLSSVFDAVKPALNAHGFFLFQRVTTSDNAVSAETFLAHKSGETLSSGPFTVPFASLQNRGTNTAQALGSARTYACRYSVSSFLCVVADDDDDGNAASEPAQPQAPQRLVASQALKEESAAAAANGMTAYKAYFDALNIETRRILIGTGLHTANKVAAEAADLESQHE